MPCHPAATRRCRLIDFYRHQFTRPYTSNNLIESPSRRVTTAFFHAWELHGTWDRARREFRTKDPSKAEAAAALHQDALRLLEQAVKENRYQARGVIGIFPANSTASHDDITVWADESRTIPLATLLTQRQQLDKQGKPRLALADFIAPEGVRDYVGAMAVSIHGSRRWAKEWEARNDSYRALLVSSLADRLVEAFAASTPPRFWPT